MPIHYRKKKLIIFLMTVADFMLSVKRGRGEGGVKKFHIIKQNYTIGM